MVKIFPNITTHDLKEVKEKLKKLQGVSNWVHFDIIDGKFTDTKTVTVSQIKDLDLLKKINLSFHLMTIEPVKLVKELKDVGAKVIVGQIEKMSSQKKFVKQVKDKKMKAGLALDDGSKVEDIEKDLLPKLDIVLIMAIKAGWIGRSFKRSRLKEIRKLKELKEEKGYKYKIAVDGGVNDDTIKDCVKAGAEYLFMHSAIWKDKNIKKRIEELKRLALLK